MLDRNDGRRSFYCNEATPGIGKWYKRYFLKIVLSFFKIIVLYKEKYALGKSANFEFFKPAADEMILALNLKQGV